MDKSKIAVDLFNRRAREYDEKYKDFDLYNDTLDIFCANIKEDADILELGCGPGNITKYLLKKRPDFKILGIDLAPNMIELAKINNPKAEFQLMDCRDIHMLTKKYDGIMCGFCLPYLSKEEALKLISDARELLKSDGVLYLSTMEDEYARSGFKTTASGEQLYIHYHEAGYLTQALKENDFKIADLQRKNFPEQDGTTTIDLVIIAKKSKSKNT